MYSRKSLIFYSSTVIGFVLLLFGSATNAAKKSKLLATNPETTA
jgi:hypothetical protein